MQLNLDYVRGRFPAFQENALRGQAFFENAGGSYTCAPVIERLVRFYHERKVQPYAAYAASRVAGEEMDEARIRLAALLGVQTDELCFGPSTSQNTYVLAQAFRRWLPEGAAIIVTDQDHEANAGVWRRLAEDGFEIREWRIDAETGHLDPRRLDALLDARVKLVVFPHVSNVVGEINDAAAIVRTVHAAGAVTCVDGVSYAPHGLPDVGAIGSDIYLFSAYKAYGPHQGVMVIRHALAESLPNQAHHFNADTLYKRFTPAGPDHAQVAACAGMADYIDELYNFHHRSPAEARVRAARVHDLLRTREIDVLQPVLDFLESKNSIRLLGPADARKRAPTLALDLGRAAAQVAAELAPHGIMAAGGDFYAQRPLQAMGIDPVRGVLRISFVHYTSEAELDRLMEALDHIL